MGFIKTVFAIIGAAVIIAIVATACLGQSAPSSTAARAGQSAPELTVDTYMELVAAEIDMIESMNIENFSSSNTGISGAVQIFEEAAKSYNTGARFELTEDQQAHRARLKEALIKWQKAAFPVLRDAYGPVMRSALWEANGSAKTIGAGYRTIEFVAPDFAANRNIAKFQEEIQPVLIRLRFTKVSYRWYDEASEYQYYTLKPPADDEVVIWTAAGTPVPVQ